LPVPTDVEFKRSIIVSGTVAQEVHTAKQQEQWHRKCIQLNNTHLSTT
jgi:hypothetical protein